MKYEIIIKNIKKNLSPDLLRGKWKKEYSEKDHPTTGHCYISTEALFWILGGSESDWMPHVLTHKVWNEGLAKGETHWFLKNKKTGKILDVTKEQFLGIPIRYDLGIANGMMFFPVGGSKRAKQIMNKIDIS